MDAGGYLETREALLHAPYRPARWTDALNSLASLCDATSVQLLTFGPTRFNAMIAPGVSPEDIQDFVSLGGMTTTANRGLAAMLEAEAGEVITDRAYLSDRQRSKDPLYREFFSRYDGHYVSSGVLFRRGGRLCNLNLFHHSRQGGLSDEAAVAIKRLLPHFSQAVRLSVQLEGRAASLSAGILDRIGVTALMCRGDGKIINTGSRADALLSKGEVISSRNGRLKLPGYVAQSELSGLLAAATNRFDRRSGSLIVRTAAKTPVRIECVPVPEEAHSRLLEPLALVIVHEPAPPSMLDREAARRAFGLTDAEMIITESLLAGASSATIASARGVSVETVNTQVKAILQKTGCSRRTRLANMMRGFTV